MQVGQHGLPLTLLVNFPQLDSQGTQSCTMLLTEIQNLLQQLGNKYSELLKWIAASIHARQTDRLSGTSQIQDTISVPWSCHWTGAAGVCLFCQKTPCTSNIFWSDVAA